MTTARMGSKDVGRIPQFPSAVECEGCGKRARVYYSDAATFPDKIGRLMWRVRIVWLCKCGWRKQYRVGMRTISEFKQVKR